MVTPRPRDSRQVSAASFAVGRCCAVTLPTERLIFSAARQSKRHGVGLAELAARGQLIGATPFDPLLASAERHQVPPFAWFRGRLHQLVPSLERFPRLQVILDHCALPGDQGNFTDQVDQVWQIAPFLHLALKWCHAASQPSRQAYPFADALPYLHGAIDAPGHCSGMTPERVSGVS
jgi:hypothetical protein